MIDYFNQFDIYSLNIHFSLLIEFYYFLGPLGPILTLLGSNSGADPEIWARARASKPNWGPSTARKCSPDSWARAKILPNLGQWKTYLSGYMLFYGNRSK